MGFLVGNDFIPHLPHLHINHDALPLLYRTYISVLPSLGGESAPRKSQRMWLLLQYNTDKVLITVVSFRLPEWKRSSQPCQLWEVPWEVVRCECLEFILFKKKKSIIIQQIYINLIKYDSKDISNVTKEIKGQICSNMMNKKKCIMIYTQSF